MNRSDVTASVRSCVAAMLNDVEATSGLQVQFQALRGSSVVAQYRFDPSLNTATVFLRADWEDVDLAHELTHMKLELLEGFAVLAWRNAVPKTDTVEGGFGRVRTYVDDEVVHLRLAQQGFTLDGEVLKSQMFDDVYTKVAKPLKNLRSRGDDGMAHLDRAGFGELCRSSFLVQAELVRKNYGDVLSEPHRKKVQRFIDAFRTYRSPEAAKADRVLAFFAGRDVNTRDGHEEILRSWAHLEGLDKFVGISRYTQQKGRYVLPWPQDIG